MKGRAAGEAGAAAAAGRLAGKQARRQERGQDRRGGGKRKLHTTELETLMVGCTWQAKQSPKKKKKGLR